VRFVNGVPFSVLAKIAAEVAQDFFWSEWFAGCHVQTPSEKRYGAAVGAAPIRGTKRPGSRSSSIFLLLGIIVTTVASLMGVHNCTGFEINGQIFPIWK
jgi:hypothetical protein